MSMVTVLTPHGRRQAVKVTPNTTLLQVLEEVCQKYEFQPQQYDLKHHNKILDVTSIFRYTGLPNNAQLELVEALKPRCESNVTLCLHIESGERLTGDFDPSATLWNIIDTLKPDLAIVNSNPVVIYMRKEICGKNNLEKTSLRNLGLTGGRAMVRFLHRSPEELKNQAHISAPLVRPGKCEMLSLSPESPHESKTEIQSPIGLAQIDSCDMKSEINQSPVPTQIDSNKKTTEVNFDEASKQNVVNADITNIFTADTAIKNETDMKTFDNDTPTVYCNAEEVKEDKSLSETGTKQKKFGDVDGGGKVQDTKLSHDQRQLTAVVLGERNALAFDLNQAEIITFADLPDDFYDLTVDDAKVIMRDAKRFCENLDNAMLLTSVQRQYEKNQRTLRMINNYKTAVVRVRFPDNTVLQGTFTATETVASVIAFVSNYLQDPSASFYLYTTPPKCVLDNNLKLIEANLVPNAVVYFGLQDADRSTTKPFLSSDVLAKLSWYSSIHGAVEHVKEHTSNCETSKSEIRRKNSLKSGNNESASTSSEGNTQKTASPSAKIPKWFKGGGPRI